MEQVPAAIKAVLSAIGLGGQYVMAGDITAFFTRIKRLEATQILSKIISADSELESLIESATKAELENLAELKSLAIQ